MGSDLLGEVCSAVPAGRPWPVIPWLAWACGSCRCLRHGSDVSTGARQPCVPASWQKSLRERALELLVRIFSFSGLSPWGKAPLPFHSFCPVSRPQTSSVSFLCQTYIHISGNERGRRVEAKAHQRGRCNHGTETHNPEASDSPLTFQSLPLPSQFCPAVAN